MCVLMPWLRHASPPCSLESSILESGKGGALESLVKWRLPGTKQSWSPPLNAGDMSVTLPDSPTCPQPLIPHIGRSTGAPLELLTEGSRFTLCGSHRPHMVLHSVLNWEMPHFLVAIWRVQKVLCLPGSSLARIHLAARLVCSHQHCHVQVMAKPLPQTSSFPASVLPHMFACC